MKKFYLFLILFLFSILSFAEENLNSGIIPSPQKIIYKNENFIFDNNVILFLSDFNEENIFAVNQFKDVIINNINNKDIYKDKKKIKKGLKVISFLISDDIDVPEFKEQGYIIDISEKEIIVKATTSTGLFYAVQSLKQIYRKAEKGKNSEKIIIPAMTIFDYPAIKYRGCLYDFSRGPIPNMEYLKESIITLSEYKINFCNFYTEHLFVSSKYPDLSPQDGLTVSEIQELSDFAENYHIEIFANLQCLAHAEKILQNPFYENLADNRYNFNPANEEVYDFFENIFAEIAPAYKSKFFNINCDETEGLGSARAKQYVDSLGAATAYYKHINKIYNILKKYDKRVMIWGDIAVKYPEIIENLPKDLLIIAWSYVASDNFDNLITPFKKSGFDFMIAPGTSLWGSVFPSIKTYIKNIAYFVRDGYKHGCLAVMNTCWNDSGESLLNNAWHALIWGAEMSWKPITNTEKQNAEKECSMREKLFNENFNRQFFPDTKINVLEKLYDIDNFSEMPIENMMNFIALEESLFKFYPQKVDGSSLENYKLISQKAFDLYIELNEISQTSTNKYTKYITIAAAESALRIYCAAQKNIFRTELFNLYQNADNEKITTAKKNAKKLFNDIYKLKLLYIKAWNIENRSYWRNFNLAKYDKIAKEILSIPYYVFIDIKIDENNEETIELKTLFDKQKIYYTTDGEKANIYSNIYKEAFKIKEPTIIKTLTFNDLGEAYENEKYILYHKGIGHIKKLNSQYSKYNASYSAGGDNALANGILGSKDFRDGCWQAYQGQDISVDYDFKKTIEINSVSMRFLQSAYDWILSPQEINIFTSSDNINYKLVKTYFSDVDWQGGNKIYYFMIDNLDIKTQYLRVVAKKAGTLPNWHHATGYESYLFIDEIIIK